MNTHICLINQFIALCSCSVETVGKSIKNQPFWIVEILLKEYSQFDSRCLCYSFAVSCNMYENTHQRIPPMNGFLVEVIIYGCSMGSLLLGIQVLLCVLGTFFSFSRSSRTVACASSTRQNDRINFWNYSRSSCRDFQVRVCPVMWISPALLRIIPNDDKRCASSKYNWFSIIFRYKAFLMWSNIYNFTLIWLFTYVSLRTWCLHIVYYFLQLNVPRL